MSVRQNGTDVEWRGCRDISNTTCPRFTKDDEDGRNCAKDNQCSSLDGMFLCELGTCWNITEAYSCGWDPGDAEPPLNCYYKRNCIELDGMVSCDNGHCSK